MQDGVSRWAARLGGFLGGIFLLLGVVEGISKRSDPAPLLFFVPALGGGAALILVGVFRARRPRTSVALVVIGALAAMLATAWTIVLPLLTLTLVVLVVIRAHRRAAVA